MWGGINYSQRYGEITQIFLRTFFYISQKKTMRLRDFSFYLSSTFIFEPILIKKFVWMLILWISKYFIQICMPSKVIEGHKSSSNFSINPTLPLLDGPFMLPSPNCVDLSLSILFSLSLSFSYSLSISLSSPYFAPCKL